MDFNTDWKVCVKYRMINYFLNIIFKKFKGKDILILEIRVFSLMIIRRSSLIILIFNKFESLK